MLQEWAQGVEVVVSFFFFWRAGSDLQSSMLGLIRSLLCSVISKKVCPGQRTLSELVAAR